MPICSWHVNNWTVMVTFTNIILE